MKHTLILFGLLLALVLAACTADAPAIATAPSDAVAPTPQPAYTLNVHRNFGYGGGRQIKGNFGLAIIGDEQQIASATFLIDGQEMAVVSAPPFEISFETTAYPYGLHQLSAEVIDDAGAVYTTPVREFEFVTAEVERDAVFSFVRPLLLGVGGVLVIVVLAQLLFFRKKKLSPVAPGTPRNYGIRGGAICPRCNRPFAVNFLTMNLLTRVYARCSNCGKWGLVKFASREELTAAEKAELEMDKPQREPTAKTQEEKLREQLDDSRYTDR